MENLATALRASADAVAGLGACAGDITSLDDDTLLIAQERISAHRRHVDAYAAWVAGEIARRSRYELGYAGLAQRTGFISPEALIQSVSQTTRAEAAKFIQVGTMLAETDAATAWAETMTATATSAAGDDPGDASGNPASPWPVPWQAPIATAVTIGVLSVDGAEAICKGLGDLDTAVTHTLLTAAAEQLVREATTMSVNQLFRRARAVRDELDTAGIARREKERRDGRFLKVWQQSDGMFRLAGLLDPENGMILATAIDTILSPRRGGPRFVDKAERARADELLNDERSSGQIAADALIHMVRLAVDADPGTLFGSRRPAVRVIVTNHTLTSGTGHGRIEGHPDPISLETIQRQICDSGTVGIKFDDDGHCVNVGRDQRIFTTRQRIGLAVRDGGCRFPHCDRPPSWCEAHHINHWHRDTGKTDLIDGILLCRHHHMLIHNNSWQITRDHATYWLRPPKTHDPTQTPHPMPGKNPTVRELYEHVG
jgi:hypothetical protein